MVPFPISTLLSIREDNFLLLLFFCRTVTFEDPLTTLTGVESYKNNVDLLAGRTFLGSLLFAGADIVLHSVEETGANSLRTRWTLQMTMKVFPWRPTAYFTGVSDYEVDPSSGECQ